MRTIYHLTRKRRWNLIGKEILDQIDLSNSKLFCMPNSLGANFDSYFAETHSFLGTDPVLYYMTNKSIRRKIQLVLLKSLMTWETWLWEAVNRKIILKLFPNLWWFCWPYEKILCWHGLLWLMKLKTLWVYSIGEVFKKGRKVGVKWRYPS